MVTAAIDTGAWVGSSSDAWLTPAGVMTSIALGTVPGLTAQIGFGSGLVAQTPNWKSCGVGWKPRARSLLNPSCEVRVTVKPQPGPGLPSDARGTLNVM